MKGKKKLNPIPNISTILIQDNISVLSLIVIIPIYYSLCEIYLTTALKIPYNAVHTPITALWHSKNNFIPMKRLKPDNGITCTTLRRSYKLPNCLIKFISHWWMWLCNECVKRLPFDRRPVESRCSVCVCICLFELAHTHTLGHLSVS